MALAQAALFYNIFEAGVAKSRLDSEGIESVLFDTEMNWGGLDGVPIRLMVDEDDVDEARRVLATAG
jgi:hypothetical protein